MSSLKRLMRYANYSDPLSTDETGKVDFGAAICMRGDLDPSNSWVGGGYDTKVTSYLYGFMELKSEIVNGPSSVASDGTSGDSRNRPFQWDNSTWASGQVRLRLHPSQAQKPSMQLLSGQLARCLSFALLFFMSSCLCLSLLFLSFTLRCLSFALPCGNGLAGFRQHIGKKRKQISENNRNYYFFRRQSGANAMRVDRADKGAT